MLITVNSIQKKWTGFKTKQEPRKQPKKTHFLSAVLRFTVQSPGKQNELNKGVGDLGDGVCWLGGYQERCPKQSKGCFIMRHKFGQQGWYERLLPRLLPLHLPCRNRIAWAAISNQPFAYEVKPWSCSREEDMRGFCSMGQFEWLLSQPWSDRASCFLSELAGFLMARSPLSSTVSSSTTSSTEMDRCSDTSWIS